MSREERVPVFVFVFLSPGPACWVEKQHPFFPSKRKICRKFREGHGGPRQQTLRSQPLNTPLSSPFHHSTPYFDRSPYPSGFLPPLPSNYTSPKTYWTYRAYLVRLE